MLKSEDGSSRCAPFHDWLSRIQAKIPKIPNPRNVKLVAKYHEYMKQSGASERHLNNQLKAAIAFTMFLGRKRTLLSVRKTTQILAFLDTKIKTEEVDPEKKWITTWNDYNHRVKRLYRWLYNQHGKKKRRFCQVDGRCKSLSKVGCR